MRGETTIWMSAVLVVTTAALHLTIDRDLLSHQTSPSPTDSQENTKNDIVHIVSGPEQLVASAETESVKIEAAPAEKSSQSNSNEQIASSSKSAEKNTESDENGDVNMESNTSDTDDKGEGGGSNENNENGSNDEAEGGSNGNNENESNGDNENGSNGDNGSNGGDENGSNGDNNNGSNGDNDNGSNGDNDNGAIGGEDGDANGNPETGDNGDETIVETTTGLVRGHAWRENAHIISYIDIKYGTFKSPFEAPVLPDRWETVHEEKDHSKRCPQLQGDQYVGDIDCLTLSIFKPSDAAGASVLVHIHEGYFINGSANPALYGPEYLVEKGIILVLPNYRLGPLGFLCLQDETAPGNAALKDLALALSWIKANIAKFGGDHENITVSGYGTAGALAGYLALSPMSQTCVSKVIMDSGSILSHWAIDRNPSVAAKALANSIDGFESWQDVDTSVLVTAAKDIVLRPCLEINAENRANFMVESPWAMIEKQEIKTTFMIGSAKYAGVHEWLNQTTVTIQQLNEDVGLLLPDDLQFETNEDRSRVGNKVKTQYFDEADISLSDVEQLTLYFTDAAYIGPGIRTARHLVDSDATVYFYEFSFVGSLNRELEAIQRPVEGAVRGDIIGYLFTQDGVVPAEDTKERRMVDQLIELWTNFIKTGTPSADKIEWNKLEKAIDSEEQWLSIEAEPSLKKGLHVNRLSLWTDIYQEYFIEKSLAIKTSSSVYTVLFLQVVFFISFFKNAWHFF